MNTFDCTMGLAKTRKRNCSVLCSVNQLIKNSTYSHKKTSLNSDMVNKVQLLHLLCSSYNHALEICQMQYMYCTYEFITIQMPHKYCLLLHVSIFLFSSFDVFDNYFKILRVVETSKNRFSIFLSRFHKHPVSQNFQLFLGPLHQSQWK